MGMFPKPPVKKEIRMLDQQPSREDLVLHLIKSSPTPLTFDEDTARLPQLSWNQGCSSPLSILGRKGMDTRCLRRVA